MFNFSNTFWKYASFQCNHFGLGKYEGNEAVIQAKAFERAAWQVKSLLSLPRGASVLDLGSGVGLFSLTLGRLRPDLSIFLLDDTRLDPVTEDYSLTHGFYNDQSLFDLEVKPLLTGKVTQLTPRDSIPACFAVVSNASCGWHYPLDLYYDKVVTEACKALLLDVKVVENVRRPRLDFATEHVLYIYSASKEVFQTTDYGEHVGVRVLWQR